VRVAAWRFGRGWSEEELARALEARRGLGLNFDPGTPKPVEEGWRRFATDAPVARERPGPPEPGGAFEQAWEAVVGYEFSDPRIVVGHFDPSSPLQNRTMLLELKALGFRFLAGTRVTATCSEATDLHSVRGFRYDTLRGHVESGWEWFLLTKSHATGEVRFRIESVWRPGDFPNAWSRLGFRILAPHYQRRWTRRASQRLRLAAHARQTSGRTGP
jgi:uncharacterized protein (UPF0548 family)